MVPTKSGWSESVEVAARTRGAAWIGQAKTVRRVVAEQETSRAQITGVSGGLAVLAEHQEMGIGPKAAAIVIGSVWLFFGSGLARKKKVSEDRRTSGTETRPVLVDHRRSTGLENILRPLNIQMTLVDWAQNMTTVPMVFLRAVADDLYRDSRDSLFWRCFLAI
jgi:hypothetical protein